MSDVQNLLTETINTLASFGKHESQVTFVGSRDGKYAISWDEFTRIADITYHSGFGGQEIATDLVVVGADWWLERHEYDGSEWWEYKCLPSAPKEAKPFTRVKATVGWKSIHALEQGGYPND